MTKTKEIRIMCPYCFHLSDKIILTSSTTDDWLNLSLNITVDEAKCPNCNLNLFSSFEDFIEIDDGIAETISILNKKGYYTEFCCEGHGEYNSDDAYIVFRRQPNILNRINNIPYGWYIEASTYDPRFTIRHNYNEDKQYLKDIQKWAEELPNLEG